LGGLPAVTSGPRPLAAGAPLFFGYSPREIARREHALMSQRAILHPVLATWPTALVLRGN